MADSMDTVISMIRGCLISTKGGVQLSALQRDYKSLVGKPIPYHEFGYNSVESFLRSIPIIKMTTGRSNEILVEAVLTEASAHIVNMVNKQKDGRKKRNTRYIPVVSRAGNRYSNIRTPLSVTLSNNSGNNDRQFRRVTLGSKSQKHVQTTYDTSSPPLSVPPAHTKEHTYKNKFEVPPRLQKAAAPVLSRSLTMEQQTPQAAGPEDLSKVFRTHLDMSENNKTKNVKQKSLTTPFSPQAAIAAGRAKCEAEAALELQKTISQYMQPLGIEIKPDYNMPRRGRWDDIVIQKTSMKPVNSIYCEKLKEYSKNKNWPDPVYKILPRYPKDSRPLFGCQVKLGNEQQFASYPDESHDVEQARELAAKKAFLKLQQVEKEAMSSSCKVTEDKLLISERVSELVGSFSNGLWSDKVLTMYREKYSENLPDDWLNVLASCPKVSIDYVSGNRVIIFPNQPSADNPLFQNPVTPQNSSPTDVIPPIPSNLVLPDDDNWFVYITCANSTTEIWIRLVGNEYSEKYESMAEEMKQHYMSISEDQRVGVPEVGQFYAVASEDSWHRVCIQDIVADNVATAWFVDLGDIDDFAFNELFKLDRKFRYLSRQAVQCSLAGLEMYSEEPTAYNVLTELLDKTFVADIKSRDLEAGVISLVLYDTSSDDDININDHLRDRISFGKYKLQLPKEGGIKEMHVSNVTPNGEVFLQQVETYAYIEEVIDNLDKAVINSNKLSTLKQMSANKLYLAKYSEDDRWYRAITTVTPTHLDKIDIVYVDYGNADIVNISDLADLQKICPEIYKLPYQALRVQLHNLTSTSITQEKLQRMHELLSGSEPVLVKVISNGEVPTVEIFKRLKTPDNALLSINNTIALDTMLSKQEQKPSQKRKLPVVGLNSKVFQESKQGDLLNTRGLQPPQIPDIGEEYFDIYVTMAANPSNFTVQPLNNVKSLQDMMFKMQDFYHDCPAGFEVSKDGLQEGGLYAVHHEDGYWYRANVINVISPELVSVHFSDFGDISVLPPDSIRVLDSQFKELPYQAIKAKLTGIVPSHSDWSIEDCLRFQDLVVNKMLVSIVMETGPDLINPNDTVIGLQIIDTATEVDIDVADLLVNEGRAIYN